VDLVPWTCPLAPHAGVVAVVLFASVLDLASLPEMFACQPEVPLELQVQDRFGWLLAMLKESRPKVGTLSSARDQAPVKVGGAASAFCLVAAPLKQAEM
jgi:hypothetical protein